MIHGYATAEATAALAAKHPEIPYNLLGRTGLSVSQVGFGSYRVDSQDATHRAALLLALRSGINLIDTSSNYADGRSEALIGSVLVELADELDRESVIIVSKVGYLQGQNYALSQQRKAEGRPFPDIVEYGPGLEHCIHPEFIEDQLTRSLERLGLECLDCYLLHNPEYYLGWAKKADMPLDEARMEYDRRLALALNYLETEVGRGRIRSYGISSNSFPDPADSYAFTSLEKVWALAEAMGEHQFRLIQLPMNLLETGGAAVPNQSTGESVLQFAARHEIGVLINRPLNGIVGNALIRLAQLPLTPSEVALDADEVEARIDALLVEERRLQGAIFDIDIPFRTKQEFAATLNGGNLLKGRWRSFHTLNNWQDVERGYLLPRARAALEFIGRRPELPPDAARWSDDYSAAFMHALRAVTSFYRAQAREMAETIWQNAVAADKAWSASTLSQTAVRALRSTLGVSSVLVGMRRPEYVADVLADLEADVPQRGRTAAWQLLAEAVESSE